MNFRSLLIAVTALVLCGCSSASDPTPKGDDIETDVAGDVVFPDWGAPDLPPGADTATDAAPDAGLEPGEPGTPCDANDDCFSGYCVQTADGARCTSTCVDECPAGWACVQNTAITDLVWICVPEFLYLCRPCTSNQDCVAPGLDTGATCESMGDGGSFCSMPCSPEEPCPDGYSCPHVGDTGGGGTYFFCVPDSGECACAPLFVSEGAMTECFESNQHGVCMGMRACTEDGLSACNAQEPKAEICNGQDDDCDGETDEDLAGSACEVINGWGVCPGLSTCAAGGGDCDGLAPAPEACNGTDDDCDGETDEDLGGTTCGKGGCLHTVENCVAGAPVYCDPFEGIALEGCDGLDNDCDGLTDEDLGEIPCGVGICVHSVGNCVDGQAGACVPDLGAAAEACNGLDDDCDGQTDEDLGETSCGLGVCAHEIPDCIGGIPQLCDPLEGAGFEFCNGADDDCDGGTDEGLGTVTCGLGACVHTIPTCADGIIAVCDPFEGVGAETCNGVDDDCDGLADEELGLVSCGQGICAHTELSCTNGAPNVCDPLKGSTAETCNGLDDDCDGGVDEELGSTTCGEGLCVNTVPICVGGVPQFCDPYLGAGLEICNGVDDDCDGGVDEDLGEAACGLGACAQIVANCVAGIPTICNPYVGASQELCDNEADDDCDGLTDCQDTGDCAAAAWCAPEVDMSNWGFEEPWTPGDPVPDFEISWGIQSSIIALRSVATVHSGAAACELTWTSPDQTKQDFAQGYLTPVTPGGQVTFGVWVRDDEAAGRARLAVTFHDAAQGSLGNVFATTYTDDLPAWVHVTATFDVPADAAFVRGFIRLYDVPASWDGNATIHIDDWSL
ncbi:MAG: MopE-related protein [Pseudomonadota bacterium]